MLKLRDSRVRWTFVQSTLWLKVLRQSILCFCFQTPHQKLSRWIRSLFNRSNVSMSKRVIYILLHDIETGNEIKINVYQALEMFQQAGSNVTSTTIQNCFKLVGCLVSDCPSQVSENDLMVTLAILATMGLSKY